MHDAYDLMRTAITDPDSYSGALVRALGHQVKRDGTKPTRAEHLAIAALVIARKAIEDEVAALDFITDMPDMPADLKPATSTKVLAYLDYLELKAIETFVVHDFKRKGSG